MRLGRWSDANTMTFRCEFALHDRWSDGRMDGRMDGWTDGQTDMNGIRVGCVQLKRFSIGKGW